MTPSHTATHVQLQQQLSQRRDALQREIEDGQLRLHEPRDSGTVHDAKDDAQQRQLSTVQDADVARDWQELQRTEAALQRIEAGTYGVCVDCGARIAPARLVAEPASLRCLACQTQAEHTAR